MELAKELLVGILARGELNIGIQGLNIIDTASIEGVALEALQRIKNIIANESLTDFECIEEIVLVLESIGSNGGGRHDFG